jgi:hypothetical protein
MTTIVWLIWNLWHLWPVLLLHLPSESAIPAMPTDAIANLLWTIFRWTIATSFLMGMGYFAWTYNPDIDGE